MSEIPDELSVLAGEYVLGVLDHAEDTAVRERAAIDPMLARAIGEWEARLGPLAELVRPIPAPAQLWRRIDRSIGVAARPPAPSGFSRMGRIGFWRAATVGSLALATVFGVIAFVPRDATRPRFAALAPTGSPPPAFLAEARADGFVTLLPLNPGPVPPGQDYELWALPKGGSTVASLGVLPATGRRLRMPGNVEGMQLLVTLEQRGGSPTGKPTGAVLYGGTLIVR